MLQFISINTAYSFILTYSLSVFTAQKIMQVQFTQEQIKTMFKVAKRLQHAFSDVKRLTTKYLLKVKKIKSRKIQALAQQQQRKKQQQYDRKKKQKYDATRSRKDKQRQQKQKQAEIEKQKQQVQPKPIFSLIKQAKSRQKDDKKPKNKQKVQPSNKPAVQQQMIDQNQQVKQIPEPTKQKTKITEKPVEPEAPYFRFLRMKRNQIRSSVQNIPMEQTSKIMRTIWDKMTDEERRPYVQYYEVQKAKYERDLHYYYQNLYKKGGSKMVMQQKEKQKEQKQNYDFIDQL